MSQSVASLPTGAPFANRIFAASTEIITLLSDVLVFFFKQF